MDVTSWFYMDIGLDTLIGLSAWPLLPWEPPPARDAVRIAMVHSVRPRSWDLGHSYSVGPWVLIGSGRTGIGTEREKNAQPLSRKPV